jgi:hypothetical protein
MNAAYIWGGEPAYGGDAPPGSRTPDLTMVASGMPEGAVASAPEPTVAPPENAHWRYLPADFKQQTAAVTVSRVAALRRLAWDATQHPAGRLAGLEPTEASE